MKKTSIEIYDHKQKELPYEDQVATIFGLNDFIDVGHAIVDALERIYLLETDPPTKLAWKSAIEDIKNGAKVGVSLYKTGLFKEELGTIFLLVSDHNTIYSAHRYLMRWR